MHICTENVPIDLLIYLCIKTNNIDKRNCRWLSFGGTRRRRLTRRRSHPAVVTLRGRLYVCGGFDGAERPEESMERQGVMSWS